MIGPVLHFLNLLFYLLKGQIPSVKGRFTAYFCTGVGTTGNDNETIIKKGIFTKIIQKNSKIAGK